jgi:hypothetical protein
MAKFTPREMSFCVDLDNGDEVSVTVRMTNPGDPGRLSGPPERCYPPEPPEFEMVEHDHPDERRIDLDELYDKAFEIARAADWTEN